MNVNAVLEGTLSGGSSTPVALRIEVTVLLTDADTSVRREAELQLSQAADADFVSVFSFILLRSGMAMTDAHYIALLPYYPRDRTRKRVCSNLNPTSRCPCAQERPFGARVWPVATDARALAQSSESQH